MSFELSAFQKHIYCTIGWCLDWAWPVSQRISHPVPVRRWAGPSEVTDSIKWTPDQAVNQIYCTKLETPSLYGVYTCTIWLISHHHPTEFCQEAIVFCSKRATERKKRGWAEFCIIIKEMALDLTWFVIFRADTETTLLLSAAFLSLLPTPRALWYRNRATIRWGI